MKAKLDVEEEVERRARLLADAYMTLHPGVPRQEAKRKMRPRAREQTARVMMVRNINVSLGQAKRAFAKFDVSLGQAKRAFAKFGRAYAKAAGIRNRS